MEQMNTAWNQSVSKMAFRKPISWSSPPLSALQMIEDYEGQLPVIAMVTKGFYGEDEINTIASNQVNKFLFFIL